MRKISVSVELEQQLNAKSGNANSIIWDFVDRIIDNAPEENNIDFKAATIKDISIVWIRENYSGEITIVTKAEGALIIDLLRANASDLLS